MGCKDCTEPRCLYSTAIPLLPSVPCTVQLYLYPRQCPVQYSYTSTPLSALYSTANTLLPSVPVEYSYTSTPLSTCRVQLYLYTPQYLYSTAVPLLPQYLYSTAIPLHPSVSVEYSYNPTPLSACTVQLYLYSPQCLYSTAIPLLPSVPVQYSYTSTPSIGCTACTEPQCLYRGALFTTMIRPYINQVKLTSTVHFTKHRKYTKQTSPFKVLTFGMRENNTQNK